METRFQLVFEDVVGSNFDIPVLKFRDTESGAETPSFILDVKRSRSYSKWKIRLGVDEEISCKVEDLFREAVKESEYKLVFEMCRTFDLDVEMLGRLCDHMIRLSMITCETPSFTVSAYDENDYWGAGNYSPKKCAVAAID